MASQNLWFQVVHVRNVAYASVVDVRSYPLTLQSETGQLFQTGIIGELATKSSKIPVISTSFYSIESAAFAVNTVSSVPPPDPGARATYVDQSGQVRSYQVWYQIDLPEGFVPVTQYAGPGLALSDYPFPALPPEPVVVDPDPRNKVLGTPGNDVLVGTVDADLIRGFEGDDSASGDSGDDEIGGGPGNDRLFGDDGNDEVYGGSGNDNLGGGTGNDRVRGGGGADVVGGGAGDDILYGGADNDVLRGGAGNDRIYAGDGNDIIYAGGGGDLITGGGGLDTYFLSSEFDSAGGELDIPYNVIFDYQASEVIVIQDPGMVEVTEAGGSSFLRNESGALVAVLQNYVGPVTIQMFVPPVVVPPPVQPPDPMDPMA
jgi:hypothetical protein